MMEKLKTWLKARFSTGASASSQDLGKSGYHQAHPVPKKTKVPRPHPEYVDVDPHLNGDVESLGPGKNVLIRNRFVREETGTHETLTILDDSIVDSGEETGIDPYNTGGFDRSKKWDQRFRK